jgi:hypothetical protein
MAQLNATASQIQLTTNMINSGNTTATWDDNTYPSAKAVADRINTKIAEIVPADKFEHPIGSVLITSTNTNPSASVGGTWTLIDKEYNNDKLHLNAGASSWTVGSASLTSGVIILAGHLSRVSLTLATTTSLSSSSSTSALTLGTISPTIAGAGGTAGEIPRNAFGVSDLVKGIVQAINKEGTETYDIQYNIDANGSITITKIFNNKTLPVGTVINLTTYIPMHKDFMSDSACNKFYWRRTK